MKKKLLFVTFRYLINIADLLTILCALYFFIIFFYFHIIFIFTKKRLWFTIFAGRCIYMLILSKQDIQKIFTVKDAICAVKQAFSIYSQGKSNVPLRVNINMPKHEGQSLFMPAYVEELDCAGVKIVSVFPKNIEKGIPSVPAKMLLVDGKTGEVCCIMDGTYLTQLRTGAASGAATELLASKTAESMVLIGTGGQAAAQLEAVLAVRSLKTVRIVGRNVDKATAFAIKMQKKLQSYGAAISVCENIDAAISEADIITAVTTSKKPVFDGGKVKKGAHINGVGSYTPEMQELDEYIIQKAGKVFVDSRDAVLSEAGDLIIPFEKGLIGKDRINGELGEVILGKLPGRTDTNEVTIFKTVGIAVTDVVTASCIYKIALEHGIGTNIDF
jgi:ornithine cyclodeaminase